MISLLLAASFLVPTELQTQLTSMKERLAPAAIDKSVVDTLFKRLIDDEAYEGDGIGIALVEAPVPEPEGPIRDLLYRRAFSHMEAAEEIRRKDMIEVWEYDLYLDGRLGAVRRILVPLKNGEPVEDAVQLEQKSPSDAAVQARWKKLAPRLLKLGKTYRA